MREPGAADGRNRLGRRHFAIAAAGALLLLLGLLVGWRFTAIRIPWLESAALSLPSCPWRITTGLQCPGCGGTRALLRLAAGDLTGALAMNAIVTLGSLATLLIGGAAWLTPAIGERVMERLAAAAGSRGTRWAIGALLAAQMVAGPR